MLFLAKVGRSQPPGLTCAVPPSYDERSDWKLEHKPLEMDLVCFLQSSSGQGPGPGVAQHSTGNCLASGLKKGLSRGRCLELSLLPAGCTHTGAQGWAALTPFPNCRDLG